jgi:hypothetical protein
MTTNQFNRINTYLGSRQRKNKLQIWQSGLESDNICFLCITILMKRMVLEFQTDKFINQCYKSNWNFLLIGEIIPHVNFIFLDMLFVNVVFLPTVSSAETNLIINF